MSTTKTYTLGGKDYVQKELSLGQGAKFLEAFKDVDFQGSHIMIMASLTRRMPALCAIVLVPSEMGVVEFEERLERPGWLASQEKTFRTHVGFAKGVMIARDFLRCNDIFSLMGDLQALMAELTGDLEKPTSNPLTNSGPSSAEETQASGSTLVA